MRYNTEVADELAPHASSPDSRSYGKALRTTISRREQAAATLADRDPVEIVASQHPSRLAELIPVRVGRMLQSPFAYYRGTAAVMAHDLASLPRTGHHIAICGDAHVSNFGFYASPERRVLFDLNDFDEAAVGPWEWDVKRLVTSVTLAARDAGIHHTQVEEATRTAAATYRRAMAKCTDVPVLERYYMRVESDALAATAERASREVIDRSLRKATRRTSEQLVDRITTVDDHGARTIVDQPPVMVHVDHATVDDLTRLWADYRSTIRPDVSLLLSQYRMVDYVLRVVGVGSVGTRCYVLLFEGPDGEPLFLQAKEAQPSVIQTYGRIPPSTLPGVPTVPGNVEGYRVVTGQRILQAHSDPFLGWIRGFSGERADRVPVDYYWRQFRDMKGSVPLDTLGAAQLTDYGALCATLLARAHAQSPNPGVIAGYLGKSEVFDDAVTSWASSYADQVERDFAALEAAVAAGRLPAERDA